MPICALTISDVLVVSDYTFQGCIRGGYSPKNPGKLVHYIKVPIDDPHFPNIKELYVENEVHESYNGNYWDDWWDTGDLIDKARVEAKSILGKELMMKQKFYGDYAEQVLEDCFVTALEGGIGDWACFDNTHPDYTAKKAEMPDVPLSIVAFNVLKDGKSLYFIDAEDDDEVFPPLTMEKFVKGMDKFRVLSRNPVIDEWFCFDAEDADIVVQLALFEDIVYG